MARSAIILGRVGRIGAADVQLPAAPGQGGFIEKASQYIDPGATSPAPTFGGAAIGALVGPKLGKGYAVSPIVGAAAGAAIGNLASTIAQRVQGGIEGSEVGSLALTTAAYAGIGAAVAHFSKKAKPVHGALIGMGLPVVGFAAYRAFKG